MHSLDGRGAREARGRSAPLGLPLVGGVRAVRLRAAATLLTPTESTFGLFRTVLCMAAKVSEGSIRVFVSRFDNICVLLQ